MKLICDYEMFTFKLFLLIVSGHTLWDLKSFLILYQKQKECSEKIQIPKQCSKESVN